MNIYYNRSFEGHYPVGTSALVVADSAKRAAEILNMALVEQGLGQGARVEDMVLVDCNKEQAIVLNNGDY